MSIITELKWASMTAAINEIKSPNRFLTRLLYGDSRPQSTETIEVDTWVRGRIMAPFVTAGAEAIPVEGPSKTRAMIEAPNIRIKRNLKPHEMMFGRTPGSVIFPTTGQQSSAIREHMAKELQPLADDITNTIEWMAAQTLTGTLTYSVNTGDAFTITYNKSAGNTVDISGSTVLAWNGTGPQILHDIHKAKRQLSKQVGLPATDCVLSETAADAFLKDSGVKTILDQRNVTAGEMTFVEQFNDDGVIYLGRVGGVRFWEYGRSVSNNGSDTALIRAGYAEFLAVNPAMEWVLYYGAIPDMDALDGRSWVGERFAKSWRESDPSTLQALVHSRPLPVPRRPDAVYSLKVV